MSLLLDTIHVTGIKRTRDVITISAEYPSFIHPQVLMYRQLTRSIASSRAYTAKRYREELVYAEGVHPHFTSSGRGMLGGEMLTDEQRAEAGAAWDAARRAALEHAARLEALNVHQEVVNRILAPFARVRSVMTGYVTAFDAISTERTTAGGAQAETVRLAERIRYAVDALEESPPDFDDLGQAWHIPAPLRPRGATFEDLYVLSVSAGARASYGRTPGDLETERAFVRRLYRDRHLNPFEHAVCFDAAPLRNRIPGSHRVAALPWSVRKQIVG